MNSPASSTTQERSVIKEINANSLMRPWLQKPRSCWIRWVIQIPEYRDCCTWEGWREEGWMKGRDGGAFSMCSGKSWALVYWDIPSSVIAHQALKQKGCESNTKNVRNLGITSSTSLWRKWTCGKLFIPEIEKYFHGWDLMSWKTTPKNEFRIPLSWASISSSIVADKRKVVYWNMEITFQ